MMADKLSDPLTMKLPVDVLADIEKIAGACDRTRSWVIVRALKSYLAAEGKDILAVIRGREQIAAGEWEDLDDVIDDLDRIIAIPDAYEDEQGFDNLKKRAARGDVDAALRILDRVPSGDEEEPTLHLLSTPANSERLSESVQQLADGKAVIKDPTDDVRKG